MNQFFDPYHLWLGIPEEDRPPDHYRLLGVELWELNGDIIVNSAERQFDQLRRHVGGEHRERALWLYDEVKVARDCLLDIDAHRQYAAELEGNESRPNNPSSHLNWLAFAERFDRAWFASQDIEFDAQHHWLGIPPGVRPVSNYRLLGLSEGEQDSDVIRSAAERQTAYVRKFAIGERSEEANDLLRELSKARIGLLESPGIEVVEEERNNAVWVPALTRTSRISRRRPRSKTRSRSSMPKSLIVTLGVLVMLAGGYRIASGLQEESGKPNRASQPSGTPAPKPESIRPNSCTLPITEDQVAEKRMEWARYLGVPAQVSTQGGQLVLIPPGPLIRGTNANAKPRQIEKPFYISTCEVTQAQYGKLMGENPSRYTGTKDADDAARLPVENVSWFDAVKFCNALSKSEGLQAYYTVNGTTVVRNKQSTSYRLLNAAERDYVAAEGSEPAWHARPQNVWEQYSWCKENSGNHPHFVATKRANVFDVFDLYGNVVEWCNDFNGHFRGVAYGWSPRPGVSFTNNPAYDAGDLGFRVARSIDMPPAAHR